MHRRPVVSCALASCVYLTFNAFTVQRATNKDYQFLQMLIDCRNLLPYRLHSFSCCNKGPVVADSHFLHLSSYPIGVGSEKLRFLRQSKYERTDHMTTHASFHLISFMCLTPPSNRHPHGTTIRAKLRPADRGEAITVFCSITLFVLLPGTFKRYETRIVVSVLQVSWKSKSSATKFSVCVPRVPISSMDHWFVIRGSECGLRGMCTLN